MSFFGCLATGVVMVEYITPPDLPLMDSQLGSSWAHIGWGEQARLVRANRGQSTNIFSFAPARSGVDNHTDDKTHDSHHWQLR